VTPQRAGAAPCWVQLLLTGASNLFSQEIFQGGGGVGGCGVCLPPFRKSPDICSALPRFYCRVSKLSPVLSYRLRMPGCVWGPQCTRSSHALSHNPWVPSQNPWVPFHSPWVPSHNPWVPSHNPWVPSHSPWVPRDSVFSLQQSLHAYHPKGITGHWRRQTWEREIQLHLHSHRHTQPLHLTFMTLRTSLQLFALFGIFTFQVILLDSAREMSLFAFLGNSLLAKVLSVLLFCPSLPPSVIYHGPSCSLYWHNYDTVHRFSFPKCSTKLHKLTSLLLSRYWWCFETLRIQQCLFFISIMMSPIFQAMPLGMNSSDNS